jgi:probable phage ssDNA binding protein
MDLNSFSFDIDTMSGGEIIQDNIGSGYAEDSRFYKLDKDKNGNGMTVIRFLPDGEVQPDGKQGMIKKLYKIAAKRGKQFVNEWSPVSINQPDPFQEKFSKLWNEGKQEEAKCYGRKVRYITNIKVINDPKNPENNGKIFLLDMSKSLTEKIQKYMSPSPDDQKIGIKPKNLFNPLQGYNFILRATKGTNNIINYDTSIIDDNLTAIYNSTEDAVRDIVSNCYKLSEWDKPEAYKSYDELVALLNKFDANDAVSQPIMPDVEEVKVPSVSSPATVASTPVTPVTPVQPQVASTVPFDVTPTPVTPVQPQVQSAPQPQANDLDALIANLTK